MKLKRILTTTFLASILTLGVGLFVANNNKAEIKPAEAAETTKYNDTAVYLDTSSCWKSGNNDERFAVYWASASETGWYSMVEITTNFYGARLPEKDITLIIYVRFPKNDSTNDWTKKWNQTGDLAVADFSKTNAVFKVSAWDNAGKTDWKANSGYATKFTDKYVACADNNWNAGHADYKLTLDMGKAEARLEKAFAISGSETKEEMKITNGSWDVAYGQGHVITSVDSSYVDITKGGDNNIGLKVEGTYEIYWKYLATDGKEIWIQIGSDIEADTYAQTFLSSITCTSTSTTFAKDVWNKVGSATTSMEYKFEQLTSGARHLLQNATANQSGSNIEKCVARYDRILSKYGYGTGENQYHDFMTRTPATQANSRIVLGGLNLSNNSSMMAIVIVSVLSITALGGYFFFKKSKHEND